MSLQQHASVFHPVPSRSRTVLETDSSLRAVVLWAALGLVLTALLLQLDANALAGLQALT